MYTLIWTSHFVRSARKFKKRHPELNSRIAKILRDLEANPFQSHLRLHPLTGELKGLHAISLTQSYRITLTLKLQKNEIILLDIGSHDEVYR